MASTATVASTATRAGQVANIATRVGLNTSGSASIGGVAAGANEYITTGSVSAETVVDGAATGAVFGLGGAVAGETIEGVSRAVAGANYSATPTSVQRLGQSVADFNNTVVNAGQHASPAAVASANVAANTIASGGPAINEIKCIKGAENDQC